MSTINTLNEIIKETIDQMNSEIAEDLVVNYGYDFDSAIKLVTEFTEFDIADSSESDF
jgi:hypothetical protein